MSDDRNELVRTIERYLRENAMMSTAADAVREKFLVGIRAVVKEAQRTHDPNCASFDFDPEKQRGPDKECDCRKGYEQGYRDGESSVRADIDIAAEIRKEHAALEEIARTAETALAGGLPHWSKNDFAETIAHVARHALGEEVSFDSVQIRCKLRYDDGRVEHIELPDRVKLTTKGKPPFIIQHEGVAFEHGHNRRTIDGRWIYDEVTSSSE